MNFDFFKTALIVFRFIFCLIQGVSLKEIQNWEWRRSDRCQYQGYMGRDYSYLTVVI